MIDAEARTFVCLLASNCEDASEEVCELEENAKERLTLRSLAESLQRFRYDGGKKEGLNLRTMKLSLLVYDWSFSTQMVRWQQQRQRSGEKVHKWRSDLSTNEACLELHECTHGTAARNSSLPRQICHFGEFDRIGHLNNTEHPLFF